MIYNFLYLFYHFSNIGLTEDTLAELENEFIDKSLLIFVVCESIILTASFIILTGILSGPVAFFGFKCLIILLISTAVADSKVKPLSSERTLSLKARSKV